MEASHRAFRKSCRIFEPMLSSNIMELWIPITIAAAFMQNLRSALQKHLQGSLGTRGASFVRFGYGFPIAIAYVLFLYFAAAQTFPSFHAAFFAWAVIGGLAQIFATMLLVHLFSLRNFAVGTAYSKTEPVQAALFGFILLGEKLTTGTIAAIFVGVIGVMTISMARRPLSWRNTLTALTSRTALIGIASGGVFGISAVAYRSASLSLEGAGPIMSAAVTLACVTTFQTAFMLIWMAWKDKREIVQVLVTWRSSALVGIAGVVGSACWFTAMTLQQVAYVRALGQIELVFTFIASWFLFRERINAMELAGCLLIVSGILGLLFW
jgi:drug/metabolite transporter (DMT)-like permease